MNNHEIIISGVHLDLTEALKNIVKEKVGKLFLHEERIIRVRVELESVLHRNGSKRQEYIAKGHIEINGPPMVVSAPSEDIYKSVDAMVDKLDRKLRRRARMIKVKRNHPHDIEFPASLPKVGAA